MKTCHTCKRPKSLEEFGNNKRNKDGKQPYCKECGKDKDRKHYLDSPLRKTKIMEANEHRRLESIKFVVEYLKDHPCVDCGEDNPILLEFDHRCDKVGNVSSMFLGSRERLVEEMEKCDVRCVRCHRLKTAEQLGYYKAILASLV